MLIDLNYASHHAAIVLETSVPIGVTQHEIGRAVGSVLVGAMKETAQKRLNPEHIEVVPAHRES